MRYFIFPIALLLLWAPSVFSDSLDSSEEQLSYAIGVKTAEAFKEQGVEINPSTFKEGLEDATQGNKLKMSEHQIDSTLLSFRKKSLAELQDQHDQLAAENQKAGVNFLEQNKRKTGIQMTPSGLQYKIIKPGSGVAPSLKDTVTVDYEGTLINGKVFDSTYRRANPATFPVRGVIRGWQEALVMMKPGAVWMLYIPSDLAYGPDGGAGIIGPNETLIFKVHLISVQGSKKY